MCEFVVYIEEEGTKKEVTRNIVVTKKRAGKTALMDAMGTVTYVEDVNIQEVNTLTQEMILIPV